MNVELHRAEDRGVADFGWLKSHHSFSFGHYYDAQKMGFGALRVLNDDVVAPGRGFDTHPHQNMEIISIPLQGALKHRDTMGNETIISAGDIQVMSAGAGVQHSEYNASESDPVSFLQIWIIPQQTGTAPSYDQKKLSAMIVPNTLSLIASADTGEQCVFINQQAWVYLAEFSTPTALSYRLKGQQSGIYAFVINGTCRVASQQLGQRDASAISGLGEVDIQADADCRLLFFEVPLELK